MLDKRNRIVAVACRERSQNEFPAVQIHGAVIGLAFPFVLDIYRGSLAFSSPHIPSRVAPDQMALIFNKNMELPRLNRRFAGLKVFLYLPVSPILAAHPASDFPAVFSVDSWRLPPRGRNTMA